jgi:hypothetical protein
MTQFTVTARWIALWVVWAMTNFMEVPAETSFTEIMEMIF